MENSKYFVTQYGGLFGNDLLTPVGRCAFVYLDKPNTKFSPPKYSVTILFEKSDDNAKKQLKEMQVACNDMVEELAKTLYAKTPKKSPYAKFKEGVIAAMSKQPFLRDGDTQNYAGFEGHWYIVAKNEKISQVSILDDRYPAEFEAGMLVRAQVQPYLNEDGFSYKLRGLKLVKDDGFRFQTAPAGDSLLKGLDDAVEAVKAKDMGVGEAYDNAIGATEPAQTASQLDIL